MTFSQEWEYIYRANTHMSIWPWSDVVSYVHRYAKPVDNFKRVLEMGCGAGANIPFFLQIGVDYWGVDGSHNVVAKIHEKYPELTTKIIVADFSQSIPFEGEFDLVVDRSSLVHNTTTAINRCLMMIFKRLREGGKIIGIDWFSSAHQDANKGLEVDSHTRCRIPDGHLAGTGTVHFCDQEDLLRLLTDVGFQIERLEHKCNDVLIPLNGEHYAWWNFVAVKPVTFQGTI